jgi:hypothetical protein
VAARLRLNVFVVSSASGPIRPPGTSNVSMVLVGDSADATRAPFLRQPRGAQSWRSRGVGDGYERVHNPTLTAHALAWRSADHLTKNWKAIASG